MKLWKCGKGEVKEETFMKNNIDRSSRRRCSVKKGVLKNFTNFTGKHLYSPVTLAKFLETFALKNICERLLLHRGCECDVDDVGEDKDKRIG